MLLGSQLVDPVDTIVVSQCECYVITLTFLLHISQGLLNYLAYLILIITF